MRSTPSRVAESGGPRSSSAARTAYMRTPGLLPSGPARPQDDALHRVVGEFPELADEARQQLRAPEDRVTDVPRDLAGQSQLSGLLGWLEGGGVCGHRRPRRKHARCVAGYRSQRVPAGSLRSTAARRSELWRARRSSAARSNRRARLRRRPSALASPGSLRSSAALRSEDWRRERDSNPRYPFGVLTLSKRAR